jgi:GNAT superfamily N-acetyltransferase
MGIYIKQKGLYMTQHEGISVTKVLDAEAKAAVADIARARNTPVDDVIDRDWVFAASDEQGQIIGGAIVHLDPINETRAQIVAEFVDPRYHGRGIGHAILEEARRVEAFLGRSIEAPAAMVDAYPGDFEGFRIQRGIGHDALMFS